jgi:hypothetical protein
VCVADACQRPKGYHDSDPRLEARESQGNHAPQVTANKSSLMYSTTPPSHPSSLPWGRTQGCHTITIARPWTSLTRLWCGLIGSH